MAARNRLTVHERKMSVRDVLRNARSWDDLTNAQKRNVIRVLRDSIALPTPDPQSIANANADALREIAQNALGGADSVNEDVIRSAMLEGRDVRGSLLWEFMTDARSRKERAERERAERERAERERAEQERAERERAEQELEEQERAERERAEQELEEQERAEQERAERERWPLALAMDEPAHTQLSTLVAVMRAGLTAYIYGQPGDGKTHAVQQAADLLGLDHYRVPVGPTTTSADLFGYMSPSQDGVRYVDTATHKAYASGGVVLYDEIDTAHPGVAKYLAPITDGSASVEFPHGRVDRHANFIAVFASNSSGDGSDLYAASVEQDRALIDRTVRIEWTHDTDLEALLLGRIVSRDVVGPLQIALGELRSALAVAPAATASVGLRKALAIATLLGDGCPYRQAVTLAIGATNVQAIAETADALFLDDHTRVIGNALWGGRS